MRPITTQLPFSAKIVSPYLPPPKKSSSREREYLRTDEVKAMIRAATKVGRHGVRDSAIILLMFRHGAFSPDVRVTNLKNGVNHLGYCTA